jgi:NTP pyrophosphatase (non-canonical NTP hydrolase)
MNDIENILHLQQQLQELINSNHPENIILSTMDKGHMCEHIKNHAFFMQEEVTELLIAIGGGDKAMIKPWSAHHKLMANEPFVSTDKVKSEAIDMLCFCLNICLAVGINHDNIYEEYSKVWRKNVSRQHDGY